MPNWTSCSLIIRGSKKQLDKIEETKFDFNNIIPMPKELQLDTSDICVSCGDKLARVKDSFGGLHCKKCDVIGNIGGRISHLKEQMFQGLNEKEIKLAKTWISKYGTCSWYDWSITNWGTKWNASEVEISRESPTVLNVYFATPWNLPNPILRKLSEQCSEIFVHADDEGGESYEFKIENELRSETVTVDGDNNTMYLGGAPSRDEVLKI